MERALLALFQHHDIFHDSPCSQDCARIFDLADAYERETGKRVPWGNGDAMRAMEAARD